MVQTGDMVTVDVEKRLIQMEVNDDELKNRERHWRPQKPRFERGYGYMFSQHIEQAPEGCDFDFLRTNFGAPIEEPDIF